MKIRLVLFITLLLVSTGCSLFPDVSSSNAERVLNPTPEDLENRRKEIELERQKREVEDIRRQQRFDDQNRRY